MVFDIVAYEYTNAKIGKIVGRDVPSLTEARKIAYKAVKNGKWAEIYDNSTAGYVDFLPTGQRLKNTMGEEVAMVTKHNAGAFAGTLFYYPNYHSQYYKKRNAKYHKYFLNSDGTLGQGTW